MKAKSAKYKKGGTANEPISFLEIPVTYNRTSSISSIFDYNFSKFLQLRMDINEYINISNDYLNILNENKEIIEEYRDEELNPEFVTFFNTYDDHPTYKGIYTWRFKIMLPEHNSDTAKKCNERTLEQLLPKFRKLIKTLPGNKIYKSKNKSSTETDTLNEEEYIALGNKYVIYILFDYYSAKYSQSPEFNVINITANYMDLNKIENNFNFQNARSRIFEKMNINPQQKWYLSYHKGRKKVEDDAVKSSVLTSGFTRLEENLTRRIFKTANKLTQYTDGQISQMMDYIIQRTVLSNSRQ
jgi:hypothetical protein